MLRKLKKEVPIVKLQIGDGYKMSRALYSIHPLVPLTYTRYPTLNLVHVGLSIRQEKNLNLTIR